MILKDWEEKNKICKNYAHFDRRVNFKNVKNYIYNKSKIETHSFYPFIHSELEFKKYAENQPKKIKKKTRPICYSSHLDRLIFSYYSYKLNEKYNEILKQKKLDQAVIAYRTNLRKNNIHFAKEAFEFIKKMKTCNILIGDFTSFFDNLNHKHLKKKLYDTLEVTELEKDWYAIYKNITKYSKCDLKQLLEINGLKVNQIKELNKKKQVLELEEFKRLKKEKKIKIEKNREEKGIPQGSAISAVLSNVYMLDFDEKLNNYTEQQNGLYLRYSDDFIIIIPNKGNFAKHYEFIKECIAEIPNLELEETKTQQFEYNNGNIIGKTNRIDYLGFSFDGKYVRIRDKTVSKYYYRMYKKIKPILRAKGVSPYNNKITCKVLYEKYSIKGAFPKSKDIRKGNFITYVKRAEDIFGDSSEKIKKISNVHMRKIRKKLKNLDQRLVK